jgi:HK97 family phage prohead protease
MAEKLSIPLRELKLSSDGLGEREFEGHGSVFKNVDLGGDIVMPGAFRKSLADHAERGTWPLMAWMHDPSRVPGKWTEIREDSRGLYVRGVLAKTPLGDEARELLRMQALAGLSIGYRTVDSGFDSNGHRLLKAVELFEVSIVSMPMNPRATVADAKVSSALREQVRGIRDWEKYLKLSFGLSNRQAARAATGSWKSIACELGETAELDAIQIELAEVSAASALLAAATRIRRI